jgi:hypothetical protein
MYHYENKMELTYSAGRNLSNIDAESLTETDRNSNSAHWGRGSSGIGEKSCKAQEESRSLLHVDSIDRLIMSS